MIIFGTRGITTTPKRGDFYCPLCQIEKPFMHKRVRKFFTLYFIPVIPLNKLGEYIECRSCKGTFAEAVLDLDPDVIAAESEAVFQTAIKMVMIHMLLADGEVDDAEVHTALDIFHKIAGTPLDESAFRQAIEKTRQQPEPLIEALTHIQGTLNDEGKEMVLHAAYLVAMADEEYQAEEEQLINQIGAAMGMSKAHVHGVLTSA